MNQDFQGQSLASFRLNDSAKRFGAAGLEPAISRSSGANTAYKTAALPIKLCPALGRVCWLRRLDSNQNLRLQRPSSYPLDDTAKRLVAGEGVAPSACQAYETCEPLLLYARENFSEEWLVVDSHHSLRFFKPTLEALSATQPKLRNQVFRT